jgi:hypothetical protein
MDGNFVFIVSEIGIDYENVVGVYTVEWAIALANRLEFTGRNGDCAYFKVRGGDTLIEMRRVQVNA